MSISRRGAILTGLAGSLSATIAFAQEDQSNPGVWMEKVLEKKALGSSILLGRFVERVYFVAAPGVGWKPSKPTHAGLHKVDVPVGFITDLASIPTVFCAKLPSDGPYAYAAVVHDFLYWNQSRPRADADRIFKFAMEELDVGPITVAAIYEAVSAMGGSAWDANAQLKKSGERRVLRKFPDRPEIRWADWKKQDVFAKGTV